MNSHLAKQPLSTPVQASADGKTCPSVTIKEQPPSTPVQESAIGRAGPTSLTTCFIHCRKSEEGRADPKQFSNKTAYSMEDTVRGAGWLSQATHPVQESEEGRGQSSAAVVRTSSTMTTNSFAVSSGDEHATSTNSTRVMLVC